MNYTRGMTEVHRGKLVFGWVEFNWKTINIGPIKLGFLKPIWAVIMLTVFLQTQMKDGNGRLMVSSQLTNEPSLHVTISCGGH